MKNTTHDLKKTLLQWLRAHLGYLKYYTLHVRPNLKELQKTAKLRNSCQGKKCFVFANGPSLERINLEKVRDLQKKNFSVICVNAYIQTDAAKIVPPDYYVLSDPADFGIQMKGAEDWAIKLGKKCIGTLNALEIPTLVPLQFFKLAPLKFPVAYNDYENLFARKIDLCSPRGYNSMTAYKGLALACFLGFDEIYIAGFDNDYFKKLSVDAQNDLFILDEHYYDRGRKVKITPQPGPRLGDYLWGLSVAFKKLEVFSHKKIFNLISDSLVDPFPKKDPFGIVKEVSSSLNPHTPAPFMREL